MTNEEAGVAERCARAWSGIRRLGPLITRTVIGMLPCPVTTMVGISTDLASGRHTELPSGRPGRPDRQRRPWHARCGLEGEESRAETIMGLVQRRVTQRGERTSKWRTDRAPALNGVALIKAKYPPTVKGLSDGDLSAVAAVGAGRAIGRK